MALARAVLIGGPRGFRSAPERPQLPEAESEDDYREEDHLDKPVIRRVHTRTVPPRASRGGRNSRFLALVFGVPRVRREHLLRHAIEPEVVDRGKRVRRDAR